MELRVGVALVTILIAIAAGLTQRNANQLRVDSQRVAHTQTVLDLTSSVLLAVVDAETGQRGFLITGRDEYLAPYDAALARLNALMTSLRDETRDDPSQQVRIRTLAILVGKRLALLKEGIALRRQSPEAELAFFSTGRGKVAMDAIRAQIRIMQDEERALLRDRERSSARAFAVAVTSALLTAIFGWLALGALVALMRRSLLAQ